MCGSGSTGSRRSQRRGQKKLRRRRWQTGRRLRRLDRRRWRPIPRRRRRIISNRRQRRHWRDSDVVWRRDSEDGIVQHPKHPFVTVGLSRQRCRCRRFHIRLRRNGLGRHRRRTSLLSRRRVCRRRRLSFFCPRRCNRRRFGHRRYWFSIARFSGVVVWVRTEYIRALFNVVPTQFSRWHFWFLTMYSCGWTVDIRIKVLFSQ